MPLAQARRSGGYPPSVSVGAHRYVLMLGAALLLSTGCADPFPSGDLRIDQEKMRVAEDLLGSAVFDLEAIPSPAGFEPRQAPSLEACLKDDGVLLSQPEVRGTWLATEPARSSQKAVQGREALAAALVAKGWKRERLAQASSEEIVLVKNAAGHRLQATVSGTHTSLAPQDLLAVDVVIADLAPCEVVQ